MRKHIRYTCIILTNPEKNTNEFIYKQWFIAEIDRWRPSYFKEQITREFFHLAPKRVNSTYNLSNDLFLVKQLYMGTYVFKICKILEISSWFVNEIMIFEMIYRNRTKRHVWAKSTKTIYFHYKYETSELY